MQPHFYKTVLSIFVIFFFLFSASAQKCNITVVVKDSATSKPVARATAVLLAKKDAALLDFGITDTLGKCQFKNVNIQKADMIVASSIGYHDLQLPITHLFSTQKESGTNLSLEMQLVHNAVELEEVVVNGKTSPIRMIKDTIEFNANYFTTAPNAMLEDLLRRLPGVEIRNKKEVYVNGQLVNKILIDGKEFFSNDPIVILKNLPAELIAKVQVADEKNTIAKETREQQDIPKTINLKLKKEFKKGVFGKFFGGYGSKDRYEAGGLLNTFRDTLQVSFIGATNNQGSTSFSMDDLDKMGGFDRSQGMGGVEAWDVNGGSVEGIETKKLAGVNINYNMGKNIQVNGQYFYNGMNTVTGYDFLHQQLIGDTSLFSRTKSNGRYILDEHKANASIRWKQDSTGYLSAQLNLSTNNNKNLSNSFTRRYSEQVPLLSESQIDGYSREKKYNIYADINYSKTFVKRHLDWYIGINYTGVQSSSTSHINSHFRRIINSFQPDSLLQQKENEHPDDHVYIANQLTKTWKDKHSLVYKNEYSYRNEITGGNTFQFSNATGKNELVPSLSVGLRQQINWLSNYIGYRYGYKKLTLQAGVSYRNLLLHYQYSGDTIPSLKRNYYIFAPYIELSYRWVRFTIDRSQNEPPSYMLRPITDSSNPFYVSVGNPDLKPTTTTNYSFRFYNYFKKANLSINGSFTFQKKSNVVNATREVFADGKTISSYINYKSVNAYYASGSINKTYNTGNFNFNVGLGTSYYLNNQPVLLNKQLVNMLNINIAPYLNTYFSFKNKYTLQVNYHQSYRKTTSGDPSLPTSETFQHNINNELTVPLHKKLTFETRLSYTYTPNMQAGFQKSFLFCNAALTASILKQDKLQVKLTGFDILNQRQGIYRSTYQNTITDQKILVQQRYFMLTAFYTFRKL